MAAGAGPRASNHFRFRCRGPGRWRGGPLRRRVVSGGNTPCRAGAGDFFGSRPGVLRSRDCYRPGTEPNTTPPSDQRANGGGLCWLLRETSRSKMAAASQRRPTSRLQPRDPQGRPPQDGNDCRATGRAADCPAPYRASVGVGGRQAESRSRLRNLHPRSQWGYPRAPPRARAGNPGGPVAPDPGKGAPPCCWCSAGWAGFMRPGEIRPGRAVQRRLDRSCSCSHRKGTGVSSESTPLASGRS